MHNKYYTESKMYTLQKQYYYLNFILGTCRKLWACHGKILGNYEKKNTFRSIYDQNTILNGLYLEYWYTPSSFSSVIPSQQLKVPPATSTVAANTYEVS